MLLIPRILERLPQRIDHESLLLALYMAREAASPHFRLGYNSLGAFATINHLHFQVGIFLSCIIMGFSEIYFGKKKTKLDL